MRKRQVYDKEFWKADMKISYPNPMNPPLALPCGFSGEMAFLTGGASELDFGMARSFVTAGARAAG